VAQRALADQRLGGLLGGSARVGPVHLVDVDQNGAPNDMPNAVINQPSILSGPRRSVTVMPGSPSRAAEPCATTTSTAPNACSRGCNWASNRTAHRGCDSVVSSARPAAGRDGLAAGARPRQSPFRRRSQQLAAGIHFPPHGPRRNLPARPTRCRTRAAPARDAAAAPRTGQPADADDQRAASSNSRPRAAAVIPSGAAAARRWTSQTGAVLFERGFEQESGLPRSRLASFRARDPEREAVMVIRDPSGVGVSGRWRHTRVVTGLSWPGRGIRGGRRSPTCS
jgi:hypothetical protein